jgi:hypothetical protein
MTNHVARLYAIALSLVVFFVTWAAVSARPWTAQPSKPLDPRLAALQTREAQVHRESIRVRRVVKHRWHVYRVQLKKRKRQIAAIESANAQAAAAAAAATAAPSSSSSSAPAPPSVTVVSTPSVTSTHTS